MSQFDFADLSPDLILDALESHGVRVDSGLLPLNSYENRVYQFLDEDRKRWVVKFYRPQRWSDAQIREEHDFAFELVDEEIPVVAPVRLEGRSLQHHDGYRFALYESRGGRAVELADLDQLERLGHFLGRIHALGAARGYEHRPAIGVERMLLEPRQVLMETELLPDYLRPAFEAILSPLCEAVALAWEKHAQVPFIRLHGDCHAGNLFNGPDGIFFVDLDDSLMGPAMQDLWMLLSGSRSEQEDQLCVLAEAYEEFMPLDKRQLHLVEPLRAMRIIHHMAWLARRWSDPAFPQSFPWFSSGKYWENQILSLKECLAALDEPPLRLLTGL
ncbi:serine/threonine protein kinase [Gallaecimonas sp. GXIMD4217]|uniref:serine/threonine protein kinase n=1 Tax=Gallaecimonas sp. GXIMD4217 TaxID=3131927 RepID=UPI00311AC312